MDKVSRSRRFEVRILPRMARLREDERAGGRLERGLKSMIPMTAGRGRELGQEEKSEDEPELQLWPGGVGREGSHASSVRTVLH
jgi:hypothetical protein